MVATGDQEGAACLVNKTCTGAGLSCDTSTGLCARNSPGNLGHACQTDGDCNVAYGGLHCKKADGAAQGVCDCTSASDVLSLCDANKVCVVGGGPSGGNSCVGWPQSPFPGAKPVDGTNDNVCKLYVGDCKDHADVFPDFSNDSCPVGDPSKKSWVVGRPLNWTRDDQNPGKNFQCAPANDWKVPGSGGTGNLSAICTYTQT